VDPSPLVKLSIGSGGLRVDALASSLDGGGAFANALVDIVQTNLVVGGDVVLTARASNGKASGAGPQGNAHAVANLGLTATAGNVNVAGHVAVDALAIDSGNGAAIASAFTRIIAGAAGSGDVTLGGLHDHANALSSGNGPAKALAVADIDPP